MKKNNLKKIIGGITLSLFVGIGFVSVGNLTAKANNNLIKNADIVAEVLSDKVEDIYYGYYPYGTQLDGTSIYKDEAEIKYLVEEGVMSKDLGDLEIKFLNAKNDDEKNNIYKKIIDLTKDEYGFTDEEINKLKDGGYKNYYENMDRIYYQQLVDKRYMTQDEAEIEIKLNAAKNKEEREVAYGLLVDNLVKKNEITKEQGEKFKKDGYDYYLDNMEYVEYEKMIIEMENDGYITKDYGNELRKKKGEDRWSKNFFDLYDKYLMKHGMDLEVIEFDDAEIFGKILSEEMTDAENQAMDIEILLDKVVTE